MSGLIATIILSGAWGIYGVCNKVSPYIVITGGMLIGLVVALVLG